jgi:hypothetical protein
MVRLFDIVGGKVVPTEHCYTLESLKGIIDYFGDDAPKIYTYIFYMTCPNPDLNPFFDMLETEKEEFILKEIDGEFSGEDDLIITALAMCRKMYETPTYRAYQGIKIALDNLGKVLATETPTFGRDGSATSLLKIAERFDMVRQSFKGVYKDLQEEQDSKVRGGQNMAYDQ